MYYWNFGLNILVSWFWSQTFPWQGPGVNSCPKKSETVFHDVWNVWNAQPENLKTVYWKLSNASHILYLNFLLLLLYLFSTSFVNMFLSTSFSVQEALTKQIKLVPKLSTTVKRMHIKDFETVYRFTPSGFWNCLQIQSLWVLKPSKDSVPLGSETVWHENR